MSVGKKMKYHDTFIVELLGTTQPAITSRPSLTTTVFRLPQSTRQKLLNASAYNEESSPMNRTTQTIEAHRSQSPEKLEYKDVLQKYRERLKQERKKHLRMLD